MESLGSFFSFSFGNLICIYPYPFIQFDKDDLPSYCYIYIYIYAFYKLIFYTAFA